MKAKRNYNQGERPYGFQKLFSIYLDLPASHGGGGVPGWQGNRKPLIIDCFTAYCEPAKEKAQQKA